jgi:hypothetical protein
VCLIVTNLEEWSTISNDGQLQIAREETSTMKFIAGLLIDLPAVVVPMSELDLTIDPCQLPSLGDFYRPPSGTATTQVEAKSFIFEEVEISL